MCFLKWKSRATIKGQFHYKSPKVPLQEVQNPILHKNRHCWLKVDFV